MKHFRMAVHSNRNFSGHLSFSLFQAIIFVSSICIFLSDPVSGSEDDSIHSFTPLSGTLPAALTMENSPYVIEADVIVSPGTSVTIEKGTVLLFENFTGMQIQGVLYVKGTQEQPVIFTSKNDSYYNPGAKASAAPFDWNGIDVLENAIGTQFKNCKILYSVYGIRSQTDHFVVDSCDFQQNGKSNVSLRDVILSTGSVFFSRNVNLPQQIEKSNQTVQTEFEQDSTITAPPLPAALKPHPEKKNRVGRNILRYAGLACALGGAAGSVYYYQKYVKARDYREAISEPTQYNFQNYTSQDIDKAHDQEIKKLLYSSIAGGVGLLGILSFSISFSF